jgi:hypothetical protein
MKNVFEFESPAGILGKLFNRLVLINYMRNLLVERNKTIKEFAETGKWKMLLNEN